MEIYSLEKKMNTHVYLVGGGLRDLADQSVWSDIDFAVEDACMELAREVARRIDGTFFSMGGEYECHRVVADDRGRLIELDFTPLRGKTIEDDLKKRDFTINAMALPLRAIFEEQEPEIMDPFDGMRDFKEKVLRLVSDDAIDEDPLRMMRGFRLAATCSLQMEGRLLNLCGEKRTLLKKVAPERIRTELFKTLDAGRATPRIKQMLEMNLLQEIMPEIAAWHEIAQPEPHQFDLLDHSLKTLEYVESLLLNGCHILSGHEKEITDHLSQELESGIDRRSMLKFAAFLHDSGKPGTLNMTGASLNFHRHDEEGARINQAIAKRLRVGKSGRRVLGSITKHHMRVLHLSKLEEITRRAMDRFVRDCGSETIEILLLALADTWATRDARTLDHTDVEGAVGRLLERYFEGGEEERTQFLTGGDVMKLLGIKEGPEVGRYLNRLREEDLAGRIGSREEAEKFLVESAQSD